MSSLSLFFVSGSSSGRTLFLEGAFFKRKQIVAFHSHYLEKSCGIRCHSRIVGALDGAHTSFPRDDYHLKKACHRKQSLLFLSPASISNSKSTNDNEEYDWDRILPFEKNHHNSIKITVPEADTITDTTTSNIKNDKNDSIDLYDIHTFHSKLDATIATAQQLHKSAIWLTVPISRARLIEEASKSGFEFHHAEGQYATLNKWLLEQEESRIPTYATHQVGVGAIVINPATNEILCVREKGNNYRPWKIPGGLAELGEDLDTAIVREVYEETGISCRFLSILGVRHVHGVQFGRSDLFFVCRLEPIPSQVSGEVPQPVPQEGEIEAAAWLPLEEYRAMVNNPEKGRGHPMMSQIMKIVDQDWEENDIQRTIVPSVVPGRKSSPLYHAPIRLDSQ